MFRGAQDQRKARNAGGLVSDPQPGSLRKFFQQRDRRGPVRCGSGQGALGPVPALPLLPKVKVTAFPHGYSEGLAQDQWFPTGLVPDNIFTHLGQNK